MQPYEPGFRVQNAGFSLWFYALTLNFEPLEHSPWSLFVSPKMDQVSLVVSPSETEQ